MEQCNPGLLILWKDSRIHWGSFVSDFAVRSKKVPEHPGSAQGRWDTNKPLQPAQTQAHRLAFDLKRTNDDLLLTRAPLTKVQSTSAQRGAAETLKCRCWTTVLGNQLHL